jgi:hypothetical protein
MDKQELKNDLRDMVEELKDDGLGFEEIRDELIIQLSIAIKEAQEDYELEDETE